MTTALLTHGACVGHEVPDGHPERPERLQALLEAIGTPVFASLLREEAPAANYAEISRAHLPEYVEAVRAAAPTGGMRRIDADTMMSPGSLSAALHAAGAVIRAVDLVLEGVCQNAFCAVRPPGHHAEYDRAMGFCLFNNIAVGVRHALEVHGLNRVAIVDFDVHHGNGTQDIFAQDAQVLFCSTHQMPLYPGTGARSERGVGNIVNIPLAPRDGSKVFRTAMEGSIFPALEAFCPELVMISAGFDAHAMDPLAQIQLFEDDFDWVTRRICQVAETHASGRVVSALEGGYSLDALGESGAAHVAALIQAGERD